jgi:opacity protein-like surface antigen
MKPFAAPIPAALITFVATSAEAADGPYLGLGLAPAWFNASFHYNDDSKLSPNFDNGFSFDFTAGYRWADGWRLEAEPYFAKAHTSSAPLQGGLAVNPLSIGVPSGAAQISGDMRVIGIMANGAFDHRLDDRFSLTSGLGIGWGSVSPTLMASSTVIDPLIAGGQTDSVELAQHNETTFAWQLFVGAIYALRDDLDLQLDYRFRGISDTEHTSSFATVNPVSARSDNVQAVMFSLRWYLK